jgi:uncharacterized protein (TIGR00369 family)
VITLADVNNWFVVGIPHNVALGMVVTGFGEDRATAELPFDDKLVGNPDTGYLHGGVITSLVDAVAGLSVYVALRQPLRIATLDLRIDYLRPTTPRQTLICTAHCYKLTRQVAFVRAIAHHGDEQDAIASAVGTFRVFSSDVPAPPDTGAAPEAEG